VINGKNVSELTLEEAKAVHDEMQQRGFRVSAAASPIGKSDIKEPFEEKLPLFRHVLEVTKILGASNMRVFTFYTPKDEDPALYRDEVVSRMKTMVEIASKEGITLLIENDRGVFGDSPERLLDIFQTVNSPYLRLTLDARTSSKAGTKPTRKPLRCSMITSHMSTSRTAKRTPALCPTATVSPCCGIFKPPEPEGSDLFSGDGAACA
jgi:hypothetical protein